MHVKAAFTSQNCLHHLKPTHAVAESSGTSKAGIQK